MDEPPQLVIPAAGHLGTALNVARECARVAGEIQREAFATARRVSVKGRGNVVTETDVRIEREVAGMLRRAFPDHGLLGEETAAGTKTAGWVWIVDPIDGTRNFASGIPFFCFTIALTLDGVPVLGLTLDALRNETFEAVCDEWSPEARWGDLYVNSVRHTASDAPSVAQSVVALDLGYDDALGKQQLDFAHRLVPGLQSLRIPGCCALGLAYAASGRYDVFCHPFAYPWDCAAGLALVRAGRGVVTARDGSPATVHSKAFVAGGKAAQADFVRLWRAFEGGSRAPA